MATLDAIREAIAVRVKTLDGVRAEQEWAGPFNVSGDASVAVVEYDGAVFDSAFGGQGDAVNFKVTMLVSKASARAGRAKLDAFCDPTPNSTTAVRTAVNGNLGGLVAFATVTASSGYRDYKISEAEEYPGVEFTVTVAT